MRTILLSLVAVLALSFSAHAGGPETPSRIISLAPSTTEILFALGLQDELIGVSQFCNFPEAARSKTQIGSFSRPNIERILTLHPDLIIGTGLEQAPAVNHLRTLGFEVYVSDPENFEQLFQSIREIGLKTGKEHEADRLIAQMQTVLTGLTEKVARIPDAERPDVFFEMWNDPITTAGGTSFVDELIGRAGGRNIAHAVKRPFTSFSTEQVIVRDPDVIVLAYMKSQAPVEQFSKRFGWDKIRAVRNQAVYNQIEPDLLLRPGPRLIEGLQALHALFYKNHEQN